MSLEVKGIMFILVLGMEGIFYSASGATPQQASYAADFPEIIVVVTKVEEVTASSERICLKVLGRPILNVPLVKDWVSNPMSISVERKYWEEVNGHSWKTFVTKAEKLKDFSGELKLLNAGWVSYGGGDLFMINCLDLMPVNPQGNKR